jgi:hypothetical protein
MRSFYTRHAKESMKKEMPLLMCFVDQIFKISQQTFTFGMELNCPQNQ